MPAHAENLKRGMSVMISGLCEQSSDWDSYAFIGMRSPKRDLSSLAGIPMRVVAVQFPFLMVRYREAMSDMYGAHSERVIVRPIDLRVFQVDICSRAYTQSFPPLTELAAYAQACRVVNDYQARQRAAFEAAQRQRGQP